MCGFIGVYGPEGVDVAPELYEGLLAIQHRGQDAAGITTFTDTFHVKKGGGLVRDATNALKQAQALGGNRVEAAPGQELPKRSRISMG